MRWFKRKVDGSLKLGVAAHDGGLAAALVRQEANGTPLLTWVEDIAQGDAAQAYATLARDKRAKGVHTVSLLDPTDYSLVMVDAPEVPPAEMRAAVRWRLNEMLDFHVDDAVIDVFDLPASDGSRSNRLYAVAARDVAVKRLAEIHDGAGLALEVIDIPEFALRNLAELLPEDANGVALVALGAERGLMTVTRRGALYLSRRIDYGTTRLFGDGLDVSAANEGVLDTLIIEIQRSLDYYERHFSQAPVQSIVFAPCGLPLDGVCRYLHSQLGMTVRTLDLNELLTSAAPLDTATQARCLFAIGGALRREEVAL